MNSAKVTTSFVIAIAASTGCQLVTDFSHDSSAAGSGAVSHDSGGSASDATGGKSSARGGTTAKGGTSAKGGTTGKTSSKGGATASGGTGGASNVQGTTAVESGGTTSAITTAAGGGTAAAGGAVAVGGTSTVGGMSAIGGTNAGGGTSPIGGASAAGGATAAGGSGHKFVGGPCVVLRDSYGAASIYARGNDGSVYVYKHSTSTVGAWQKVSGLDASYLVSGADLDCSGYPTTHMVALSNMPFGKVLHSAGTDTSFSGFISANIGDAATTSMSLNTPGVAGDGGSESTYTVVTTNAAVTGVTTSYTLYSIASGAVTKSGPTLAKSLVSGTDVDINMNYQVGFTSDGYLALLHEWYNMGYTGWDAPEYYPPPTGTSFQYSPTVCYGVVFVTAGDRLWRLSGTAWEKISDIPVASGPDCYAGGYLWMTAVLTSTGSILYAYSVSGTTGGAAANVIDLGVY